MKPIEILAVGAAAILAGCCCEAPRRCGCPAPCAPAALAALPPAAAAALPAARAPATVPVLREDLAHVLPTSGPETAALREEEVRKILSERKLRAVEFTDANLDVVAEYLHTITGIPFAISPKVRAAGFADVKVNTPKLDYIAATELLALVTAPLDLRWEVRDGVVWIVTSEEAKSR